MNKYMEEAIILSEDNTEGGPFGAVIVKEDKIVGRGKNKVLKENDPTSHAEVNAIKDACKNLNTHDLSNCILYTTCYPCPMCLGAIIWSNIKEVYYGNTASDADAIGFKDDKIYEFIKGNNKIIDLKQIDRDKTIEAFKNYKGKIY